MTKIEEIVKQYDPENLFDVLVNTYKQIEYSKNNEYNLDALKGNKFNNIIVAGMGGSAIAADLIKNFLGDELKLPYEVVRHYHLPASAGVDTLVIISSYSGNTEETLQVFSEAIARGCKIVALSTGGKVTAIAADKKIPCIALEVGYQPRYSLALNFFTLLSILNKLNIIEDQSVIVNSLIEIHKKLGVEYSHDGNYAFKIAESLVGFIPVIYGSAFYTDAAAIRMKSQFNENSKLHSYALAIPEMNHNEIVGWECAAETGAPLKVLMFKDEIYHSQVKKRFDICAGLIKKAGFEVVELSSNLASFKERLFHLVFLSDWITYYTAILRGKDPGEIDFIHHLKKELS